MVLYHGAQVLNQAQIDRWNIVTTLNYLKATDEINIVLAQVPSFSARRDAIERMVGVAALTRKGFAAGDISTVMSPRTVITWAENTEIFGDIARAFRLSFLNKCDDAERSIIAEYYQRAMGEELEYSIAFDLSE